jgi:hypothetical protein
MYTIAQRVKGESEWTARGGTLHKTLDEVKERLQMLNDHFRGFTEDKTEYQILECYILQTLDPKVFEDEECIDCPTNSGIDLT